MAIPPPDGEYSFLHHTWSGAYRYEGRYKDGLRDGLWRVFYPEGMIAWQTTWSAGVWNGPCGGWWRSGAAKYEGQRQDGQHTGEWKFWLEDGQLTATGYYEEDRKVGEWRYWSPDGAPIDEESWEKSVGDEFDWAWDDYSLAPRGENWPVPPKRRTPDSL